MSMFCRLTCAQKSTICLCLALCAIIILQSNWNDTSQATDIVEKQSDAKVNFIKQSDHKIVLKNKSKLRHLYQDRRSIIKVR